MTENRYDIAIVGAGPAGLIAAIECFRSDRTLILLEKMPKPALKLRISGKGRCNITNSADREAFMARFGRNGRFLRHAFAEFFNSDLLDYFGALGVRFKLERGGRYFPRNDNALEIVEALLGKVAKLRIRIETGSEVTAAAPLSGGGFALTIRHSGSERGKSAACKTIEAGRLLIATGGQSYPKTGSDGGGYRLASRLGHTIAPLLPALVPLVTAGDSARKLKGLSLKNVRVSLWCENRKAAEAFGEMLFADYGVSGPVILTLSKTAAAALRDKKKVQLSVDLKPALDHQVLDRRLLREIGQYGRRELGFLLKRLLPMRLIPVFSEQLGIAAERRLSELRLEERKRLRLLLKSFGLGVSGCRSFDEALVTAGGVSIKEIEARTMESKLVKGLYFAGEVIDIDADTGGFNLQAAFSTGRLAGRSMRAAAEAGRCDS